MHINYGNYVFHVVVRSLVESINQIICKSINKTKLNNIWGLEHFRKVDELPEK